MKADSSKKQKKEHFHLRDRQKKEDEDYKEENETPKALQEYLKEQGR